MSAQEVVENIPRDDEIVISGNLLSFIASLYIIKFMHYDHLRLSSRYIFLGYFSFKYITLPLVVALVN